MNRFIITRPAVETIHKESQAAFKMEVETGGILIGPPPIDGVLVITSATGPGPDGKRASYASWETDPEYLNCKLREAREGTPVVNLRGFWHRHPGMMRRPSAQDLIEARRILEDVEHYKLGGELVMPIVTATQEGITIQAYYITDREPHFKEIPVELSPDSDEFMESSPSTAKDIEAQDRTEFWQDVNWQFYMSSYGVKRLEEELSELASGGHRAEAMLLGDGGCCIELEDSNRHVLFLLPKEYPINPPRVYIKRNGDIMELEMGDSSPLYRWSSAYRLAELADGVMAERCDEHERGKTRHEALKAAIEDFRHGNFGISRCMRHLVVFLRGRENALGDFR